MRKEPRTILLYGETGSTKTTQCAFIAKWLWETFGKKSRLIQCDGGGSKQFEDMGLIEEGIVERFIMPATKDKIANLFRISKGYWPKYRDDQLLFGHTNEFMTTPKEFESIGGYFFDSITGMGEILTEHVSDPERSIGFKLGTNSVEDGYRFGTLDKGHYNIIQKELRKAFEFGFNSLPVDYFIATARVAKGETNNRTVTYGPATSGNALTGDVPSWFNDSYYLETKDVVVEDSIYANAKVAWFTTHLDNNTTIPYPAKVRCLPSVVDKLAKYYPSGYTVLHTEGGIIEFLSNLAKLTKLAKKVTNIKDVGKPQVEQEVSNLKVVSKLESKG